MNINNLNKKIALLTPILAEAVRKAKQSYKQFINCLYLNFKTFKRKNHKKLYREQLLLSEVYKERADHFKDKAEKQQKIIDAFQKKRNERIY